MQTVSIAYRPYYPHQSRRNQRMDNNITRTDDDTHQQLTKHARLLDQDSCADMNWIVLANPVLQAMISVHSFNGSNGSYPVGPLIANTSGNLFGTTFLG